MLRGDRAFRSDQISHPKPLVSAAGVEGWECRFSRSVDCGFGKGLGDALYLTVASRHSAILRFHWDFEVEEACCVPPGLTNGLVLMFGHIVQSRHSPGSDRRCYTEWQHVA